MLYIFDWDGTVSNSLEKIVQCVQKSAQALDIEQRTVDEVKTIIGLSLPKAIETLYPDLHEKKRELMADTYSDVFVKNDTPTPLYPGVETTLEQLKERGHTLAVATGKSRKGLDRVLVRSGVTHHFSATRCADETASKPDPLMLFELLSELGFEPQNAVMIGDTTFDMEMARNADIKRIGVSFGSHHESQLVEYKPEGILNKFEDLLTYDF